MRAPRTVLVLLLVAAGCSRPPSVDTFTASSLPSAFVALRSPNGQRQALLIRFDDRWQGHFDDVFAGTSRTVFATDEDGAPPGYFETADPAGAPLDLTGWKPLSGLPVLVVDAWAAGDPVLREPEPVSIVVLLRVGGDSSASRAVNAALAGELATAAGLVAPGEAVAEDSGVVASRVAVEAAVRAIIPEDGVEPNPKGRMAILQAPVLLTQRFLAVEHVVYEDHGGPGGGASTVRFTLHDLQTGAAPDLDALLDREARTRLAVLAAGTDADRAAAFIPDDWYPSRPGIVLVFRPGEVSTPERGVVRRVVRWRDALPLLHTDSPLREVAQSVQ